jgi:hypothetical protein
VFSSTGFKMCTALATTQTTQAEACATGAARPIRCYLAGLSSAYNCPTNRSELPVTMGTFAS